MNRAEHRATPGPYRCHAGEWIAEYLADASRARARLASVPGPAITPNRVDWIAIYRTHHAIAIRGAQNTRESNPPQLPDSSRAPECSYCGQHRWHTIQSAEGSDYCRACFAQLDREQAEHMEADPDCNCNDCIRDHAQGDLTIDPAAILRAYQDMRSTPRSSTHA